MDCVNCGETADYDRVAVDRVSGIVLGCLCVTCEDEWLREHGGGGEYSMAACFACGAPSAYLFPRWNSIVEREGRGGSVDAEYHITLTTPASCDRCLGTDPGVARNATQDAAGEASTRHE